MTQIEKDGSKQRSPAKIFKINDASNFQTHVAIGQFGPQNCTSIWFWRPTFLEYFVVMEKLTGAIAGLHFMKHNSVVMDTTFGLILFHYLTTQMNGAATETSIKPQPVLTSNSLTFLPMTTKAITAFIGHPSEWNTAGTKTPNDRLTDIAILLVSNWTLTIFDKYLAVSVKNPRESP